jgi:hypothetical protein
MSLIEVVAAVVVEEVAAVPEAVATLVVDRKAHVHSFHETARSALRYALKRVMLLMSVGIASLRIMYQMRSLSVLHTTPTTSTQTCTLIPMHLTTSQAT